MKIIKTGVILGLILLAFLSLYFGSYRTFAKARRYISAVVESRAADTTEEFREAFDKVLNYRAPVNRVEVVKFLGSDILSTISREGQPEEVSRELVEYVEEHISDNEILHLLTIGNAYLALWRRYERPEYFVKAEGYYKEIHKRAPKLPQPIYNLLVLYRATGNEAGVSQMAEKIVRYWPQDTRLKRLPETSETEEAEEKTE